MNPMRWWLRVLFGAAFTALGIGQASAAAPATRPAATQPAAQAKVFNITRFGAVAGGQTLNRSQIQAAIDACGAAGGGRVVVPAGIFLSVPLELRSGVDLHLDGGAVLLFSRDHKDYPLVISSYEGRETVICQAPIFGRDLHDVSITGTGAIDGQGDGWRSVKRNKLTPQQWDALVKSGGVTDQKQEQWWPSESARQGFKALIELRKKPEAPRVEDYEPYRDLLRPNLVLLSNCHRILLQDATFRNSGSWNVHVLDSEDITVRNVVLFNPLYAQNGDGIDVDSCRNVLIEGINVHAGDDDICLKSGRDEQGRKHGRPTENVIIRNCKIGWGHGGIAIGSEMSGGVHNVEVSNCVLDGPDIGLRFKTTRGRGGTVEDIHIHDVTMSGITQTAILFDMYYQTKNPKDEPFSERTPVFRNIVIRNVTCASAHRALELMGLAEQPMSDIRLENVSLAADDGAWINYVKDVTLKNVRIQSKHAPPLQTQNVADLTLDQVDATMQQD
ncbi:MAG: glycoside hydrolase family 28 protein [Tepidisphaeraceae bacterium]